jgi:predicted acyl esterase
MRVAGAQAQWDTITVPMLTVGNWSGMGLHLRGNAQAFMRAANKHKKLRIHSGTHVHPFYTGRPARAASLLRLLAQGYRQRRDG